MDGVHAIIPPGSPRLSAGAEPQERLGRETYSQPIRTRSARRLVDFALRRTYILYQLAAMMALTSARPVSADPIAQVIQLLYNHMCPDCPGIATSSWLWSSIGFGVEHECRITLIRPALAQPLSLFEDPSYNPHYSVVDVLMYFLILYLAYLASRT